MTRRRQAQIGLSYVDANRGRVVSIESDVLEIGRRIEERWPELEAFWDKDQMEYIVIEHCKDGVDRFVCARPYLDERLIQDLEAADTHKRGQEDPVATVDALNAAIEARHDREFSELIGDVGERLAHALHKDGVGGCLKVSFSGVTNADGG
jgi:hypothetical protein